MTSRIDVVIVVRDMAGTLALAVQSALSQSACRHVIIVDDPSSDGTGDEAERLARAHPQRVRRLPLTANAGPGHARNQGAAQSDADYLAFLDGDDAYERQALDLAQRVLDDLPQLDLVRLAMKPMGPLDAYIEHADFPAAWRHFEFTAPNLVIRRHVFEIAGGFPEDAVFRRFGGEDGAFSLALTQEVQTGTLFDQPGIVYTFRETSPTAFLLRSHLYGELRPGLAEALPQAQAVTETLRGRLRGLGRTAAIVPILVEWDG